MSHKEPFFLKGELPDGADWNTTHLESVKQLFSLKDAMIAITIGVGPDGRYHCVIPQLLQEDPVRLLKILNDVASDLMKGIEKVIEQKRNNPGNN